MYPALKRLVDLPFKYHILLGLAIRLVLVVYGEFHDRYNEIPYTDIDYWVFSDAARHVVVGDSPYKRHTYRYSPLIAYLMIPNILFLKNFGKLLFCVFDIFVALAIKVLVDQHKGTSNISVVCSLFWLFNPFVIGISTRGSADSFPSFIIILSLLFLQTNKLKDYKYAFSGLFLGISIHLRLYPLVFSLPMYLSLGEYKINRSTGIKEGILSLLPNKNQLVLTFSCVISLVLITYGMYFLYGYEFLFETYIYHFLRRDIRHNFSVLFYYSYLTMDQLMFDIVKTLAQILEFLLIFVISLSFGCEPRTLPFALFCQAVVLVTFNSVMTSQYFIWFLSLLPLIVHNIEMIPLKALLLLILWVVAQASWLFSAYLLEFKCKEVFIFIWLNTAVFFTANVYVLAQIIKCYNPYYDFGKIRTKVKN